MPIHTYKCNKHGEFDEYRQMGDDNLSSCACPQCHEPSPKLWNRDTSGVTFVYPSGYNEQLGCHIGSKRQLRDRIDRIEAYTEGAATFEWH